MTQCRGDKTQTTQKENATAGKVLPGRKWCSSVGLAQLFQNRLGFFSTVHLSWMCIEIVIDIAKTSGTNNHGNKYDAWRCAVTLRNPVLLHCNGLLASRCVSLCCAFGASSDLFLSFIAHLPKIQRGSQIAGGRNLSWQVVELYSVEFCYETCSMLYALCWMDYSFYISPVLVVPEGLTRAFLDTYIGMCFITWATFLASRNCICWPLTLFIWIMLIKLGNLLIVLLIQ